MGVGQVSLLWEWKAIWLMHGVFARCSLATNNVARGTLILELTKAGRSGNKAATYVRIYAACNLLNTLFYSELNNGRRA